MTELQAIYTSIKKQMPLTGNEYIVLEDHYKFKGRSNLYCSNGTHVSWFAELPEGDDLFVDFDWKHDVLVAWTSNGLCVKLSASNGRVLDRVFKR